MLERSAPSPTARRIGGRLTVAALSAAMALAALGAASPVQATTRGDGLRAAANAIRTNPPNDEPAVGRVRGKAILDSIARARADQLVTLNEREGTKDHILLEHDMEYVIRRLNRADVCWRGVGEIIAYTTRTDYSYPSTIDQWWRSKAGHHEILMGEDYNAAGGSWQTDRRGTHYSVMIFAVLCRSELSTASTLQPSQEYSPDRPMVVRRGTHVVYKFSSSGQVLHRKKVTFGSSRRPVSTGRSRLGGTAYVKVSSGTLAGWWVAESGRSFVRGVTQRWRYAQEQRISFEAGRYTGYTFDSLGHVTASKERTLRKASVVHASARAIINGRPYFRISDGRWDGYWVRDSRRVDRL